MATLYSCSPEEVMSRETNRNQPITICKKRRIILLISSVLTSWSRKGMRGKSKVEDIWPTALDPCWMRAIAMHILCLKKMRRSKMTKNTIVRMMVRASQVSLSWRMSSKKYGVQLT